MEEKENNVLLLLRRIDVYREALALQQAYNRILEDRIAQIRALVVPIQRPQEVH